MPETIYKKSSVTKVDYLLYLHKTDYSKKKMLFIQIFYDSQVRAKMILAGFITDIIMLSCRIVNTYLSRYIKRLDILFWEKVLKLFILLLD